MEFIDVCSHNCLVAIYMCAFTKLSQHLNNGCHFCKLECDKTTYNVQFDSVGCEMCPVCLLRVLIYE